MKKLFFILLLFINSVYPQSKPYVVLVSIDAFRWDYLSRGITPALSETGNNGVSALSLMPAYPSKTFPNHVSIITGLYPENHGIISNDVNNFFTGEKYRMGDTNAVRESKWYQGEFFWETARRSGIVTASYFWPGSELLLEYRRPNYFKQYKKETTDEQKIEQLSEWLNMPYGKRPHFITLYFEQVDSRAHTFGPDAPETNETIKQIDGVILKIKERIQKAGLKDSLNLIILSDHGMTNVSKEKSINIEKIINDPACRIYGTGPISMIQPPKEKINKIYDELKKKENHYKVYLKKEMPEYFHFSKHPFIGDIIVVADLGWAVIDNRGEERMGYGKKLGDHGYDNFQMDMHGFFVAEGPAFKKNFKTGTLLNVDIYPLLCRIFGIEPRTNIDGKAERIEYLLR